MCHVWLTEERLTMTVRSCSVLVSSACSVNCFVEQMIVYRLRIAARGQWSVAHQSRSQVQLLTVRSPAYFTFKHFLMVVYSLYTLFICSFGHLGYVLCCLSIYHQICWMDFHKIWWKDGTCSQEEPFKKNMNWSTDPDSEFLPYHWEIGHFPHFNETYCWPWSI